MCERRSSWLCVVVALVMVSFVIAPCDGWAQATGPRNFEFVGGQWFNGRAFERRTGYSVAGRLTFKKPARIDQTIDLTDSWVVPPFAEAHNHNVGTGIEESDRSAIRRFLADGVFSDSSKGLRCSSRMTCIPFFGAAFGKA